MINFLEFCSPASVCAVAGKWRKQKNNKKTKISKCWKSKAMHDHLHANSEPLSKQRPESPKTQSIQPSMIDGRRHAGEWEGLHFPWRTLEGSRIICSIFFLFWCFPGVKLKPKSATETVQPPKQPTFVFLRRSSEHLGNKNKQTWRKERTEGAVFVMEQQRIQWSHADFDLNRL